MSEKLTGWVRGKTLELDSEAPELDGKHVRVVLEPIEEPSAGPGDAEHTAPRWTGEAEMRWLREHGREYAGRWVVLDADRLVASGVEAKPLLEEARRQGIEVPFLARVEPEPEGAFWGGWL